MSSYVIKRIHDTHDIVSYLTARGIHPDSEGGGRYKYNCPIHKEDTPSMVVYSGDEHQNFFCFGCKKGGTIIQLKMEMENISAGEAITELSKGLGIKLDDEIAYASIKMAEESIFKGALDPQDVAFRVSRSIYNFLQVVKHQEPYFTRCEKVLQLLDQLMWQCEFQRVFELPDMLDEMLSQQLEQYEAQSEQAAKDTSAAYAAIK